MVGRALPSWRFARPSDAPTIAEYHTRAWQVGYAGLMDADGLAALTPEMREPSIRHWIVAREAIFNVIEVDGTPVAHSLVRALQPGHGEVVQLYVDPDHWGKGYGRQLLDVGCMELADGGCSTPELWTLVGNERAIGLYETAGWAADGRVEERQIFDITFDELCMTRDLGDV